MLSIQHILCSVLSCSGDDEYLDKHAAAIIFPDAIKAYLPSRKFSHFEKGVIPDDISYMRFPNNLKCVTKDFILQSVEEYGHEAIAPSSVIGEDTDLWTFRAHNRWLFPNIYRGIQSHLIQDIIFDAFLREQIDCSDKYRDNFYIVNLDGTRKKVNGEEIRAEIAKVEQFGLYVLVHKIYRETGILANQKWVNDTLFPLIERDYPKDLAEKTISYMQIDPDLNKLITKKDWEELNDVICGNIKYDEWYVMYEKTKSVLHFFDVKLEELYASHKREANAFNVPFIGEN